MVEREPYNPAEETQVRAARRKVRQAVQDHAKDIREVMALAAGRRVFWGYWEKAKVFQTTFAQDPHITAFQEGARNLGLQMLADVMDACPDLYMKAQQEAKERKEIEENG